MTTLPPDPTYLAFAVAEQSAHMTSVCKYRSRRRWTHRARVDAIGLVMLAGLMAAVGCAAKRAHLPPPKIESSVEVGKGGGQISRSAEVIERQADHVLSVATTKPTTPVDQVKPQIETIKTESINIQNDQVKVDAANEAERQKFEAEFRKLQDIIVDRDTEILILKIEDGEEDGRWYTILGRFIDGICHWLGVGIWGFLIYTFVSGLLACSLSVIIPVMFPTSGLAMLFSKFITLGFPGTWFFPPIRDYFLRRITSK